MLTAQILTRNNQHTIRSTIESIIPLKARVIVGDLGSTDNTVEICEELRARVISLDNMPRDEARNKLATDHPSEYNLWLQPWEAIVQGHSSVRCWEGCLDVKVLHGMTVSHDIRFWSGKQRFINPVYERIDTHIATSSPIVIYSRGDMDPLYVTEWVEWWKSSRPLSSQPYYYQACLLMSNGKYDEFTKIADHYLFMEKEASMSHIMLRYYYAMVQLLHYKAYRPALQNINLCLCAKPLMAEFWCLMADVDYHLLRRFDQAKDFYENAIILGSRRLTDDRWPMDIAKYQSYPKKMIDSCDKLLNSSFYVLNKSHVAV